MCFWSSEHTSLRISTVVFSSSLSFQQHFITAEVLKLFSLKKEPNHKTDWQKMMKFGRKKRDRVDHILVSANNKTVFILVMSS